MKKISEKFLELTKQASHFLIGKRIPIAVTAMLCGVLVTYHNCGSSGGHSDGSSASLATGRKIQPGNYLFAVEDLQIHLKVKNGGDDYIMSIGEISQNQYFQEFGKIEYAGNKATFAPKSYLPSGCDFEDELISEKETREFSQTSAYLTLQTDDIDGTPIGMTMEKDSMEYDEFFGNKIPATCDGLQKYLDDELEFDTEIKEDEEQSNSSTGTWNGTGMWSDTSIGSGDLQSIMNQVISQTNSQRPCQQGTRLPTVHFKANVYNTNTLVAQNSQAISHPSELVYEFYIGLSNFGDAMVITKHDIGYVISLAMCPYGNSLTSSRPITAFSSPYGIVLGSTNTSKMGTILAAKETAVLLSASGAYQSMWFGPTTFFPVTIK